MFTFLLFCFYRHKNIIFFNVWFKNINQTEVKGIKKMLIIAISQSFKIYFLVVWPRPKSSDLDLILNTDFKLVNYPRLFSHVNRDILHQIEERIFYFDFYLREFKIFLRSNWSYLLTICLFWDRSILNDNFEHFLSLFISSTLTFKQVYAVMLAFFSTLYWWQNFGTIII